MPRRATPTEKSCQEKATSQMGIYLPWAWQLLWIVTACKAALSGQDIYYGFFRKLSPRALLQC